MSADSPRRATRGVPAIVPPQVVSDRSIIDNVAGFINDVALTNQPQGDPKDTIAWARFEQSADISDPTFGDDWEIDGNISPPLLLILGYGLGVQVWAIPANGEAIEVLSWRHGNVTTLRVLPTPFSSDDEMADEPIDNYVDKRPLMAICEGSTTNSGSAQTCYSVNFVSLKTGAQVKTIKFKYAVLDVLANRTSVVITFPERIAVFDARTLEDRLSVTTCYPSPGINPNPVALGPRWMAYAENKILHSKRSGGGCDGDGVSSYTATVLNAAKSFGKGLRELGEQMAAGLTGSASGGLSSKSGSFDSGSGDIKQPGIITILDVKNPIKDISPTTGAPISINGSDPIIAHFIAHSEATVAMEFDYSGMLLITADRRGHDFHVFRIQPHPGGSHLAAVHHLYILHRGDTSAKVQNITFALDSRWVAVSTLRGTTHVFPITPYGGAYGVRTHSSLHVVNKLSRFHRSAGLSVDNRSNSPISHSESMTFNQMSMPYHNPTMPPFPRPHTVLPLAQLRQPSVLASPPGSAQNLSYQKSIGSSGVSNRQRLSSLSDDSGKPLSVCAVFAKGRSWLLDPPNVAREGPAHKLQRKAVDSLFIMAGHGALIQYDLDTKLASNVAKEKICDDTPIELEVEARAQWNLGRRDNVLEIQPPLTSDNWLVKDRNTSMAFDTQYDDCDDRSERWLSQVEIITHAGPHRRLWMGPQFVFKTYNTPSGSSLSHIESEAIEIGIAANTTKPGRSSPMNMPLGNSGRSAVPVLIESGSYSSIEQSPKLMDRFKHDHLDSDFTVTQGESRLKEDLADAMRESPSVQHKNTGLQPMQSTTNNITTCRKIRDNTTGAQISYSTASMSSTSNNLSGNNTTSMRKVSKSSNLSSSITSSLTIPEEDDNESTSACISIEKIVNPLGTVTTITRSPSDTDFEKTAYDPADHIILENCDESLFRPVVTIFCDERNKSSNDGDNNSNNCRNKNINNNNFSNNNRMEESDYFKKPPEPIGTTLVVPVIEKSIKIEKIKDDKLKNSDKNMTKNFKNYQNDDISFVKKSDIKKLDDSIEKNVNKIRNTTDIKKEKKFVVEEIDVDLKMKIDNENIRTNTGAISKNKIQIQSATKESDVKNLKENEVDSTNSRTNDKKVNKEKILDKDNIKTFDQKSSKKESDDSDENSYKTNMIKGGNKKGIKNEFSKDLKKNQEIESKSFNMTDKLLENFKKQEFDENTTSNFKNKSIEKVYDEIFIEGKENELTKTNMTTRNADETKIIPQRKSSKDDDSESFESLENIEEYEKSVDTTKHRKISENFDSAEDCHHESDISSTYIGSKWDDDEDIKFDSKIKELNKSKKDNQQMEKNRSNSVEMTITLPKKNKNGQNKQKSKQEIIDIPSSKSNKVNINQTKTENKGLEFFDKFSNVKPENSFIENDVLVDVDFQTLQASLHEDIMTSSDLIVKTLKSKSESPIRDTIVKNKKGCVNTKETISKVCDNENIENIEEIKLTLPTNNKKKTKKSALQESSNIKMKLTTEKNEEIKKEIISPLKYEKNITVASNSDSISKNTIKFSKKDLEFPALPTFGNLDTDFKEAFLPSLSPLEPFETKFEDFQIEPLKKTSDHFSLINFESPESPKSPLITNKFNEITSFEPKPRGFTQDTLIFALCGSLHYENENENEKMKMSTESTNELETSNISSTIEDTKLIKTSNELESPSNNLFDVVLPSKRKNRKKEKQLQKVINMQSSTTVVTSSSTSSSEETEESSSSAACNKRQKNINDDDEELLPLIEVSMTQSISCGNGSSLSEISPTTSKPLSLSPKRFSKKPKTMSDILKGEIDDDEDDDGDNNDDDDNDGDADDDDDDMKIKNNINKNNNDTDMESNKINQVKTAGNELENINDISKNETSTTVTISIPKLKRTSIATKKSLPDINKQSDSTIVSDKKKTFEEQASSESSDEQLILSKKISSKNNKKLSTTAATPTNISTTTSYIPGNDDSSESETKVSNVNIASNNSSSGTGNDSGSGGGGGNVGNNINSSNINKNNNNNNNNLNNNNSSNNSNQNGKKKSRKKKR